MTLLPPPPQRLVSAIRAAIILFRRLAVGGLMGFYLLPTVTGLPAAAQAPGGGGAAQPTGSTSGHELILCQDGSVMGWGNNNIGQLGNNPVAVATPVSVPMPVGANIVALEASSALGPNAGSSFAIQANGQLLAWGSNVTGQLGIGNFSSQTPISTTVVQANGVPLAGVVAVSAGREFTIALCQDGTVWSWGDNDAAVLGDKSPLTLRRNYAQQIPSSTLHSIR